jgi:excinuclease ABC subunit A
MGFLPDLFDTCELCGGSGYAPSIGDVSCRGVSIREVASASLEEVMSLFGDVESIGSRLRPALDLGIGYLSFHQPSVALSGGEIQRLKIADHLRRRSNGLYILDEPTIGQHLEDVSRLVGVLQRIVDDGATVLVVEHHPHVLACCDWLVELGPGAGPAGGSIIAEGTPLHVAAGATPTARHLAAAMKR